MIDFLQAAAPAQPQPGFMQQYSFIIMIGLMVLVLWLFMWRPEAKRRKQMQAFRDGLKKGRQDHHGRRHLRHGEGGQGDHPADRGGRQRDAAHRQEHGRGRQFGPPAPVEAAHHTKRAARICSSFFISITGNESQPNRCSAATSMSRWLRLPRKSSDRSRSAST